jgi:iron complex outermembrane receptor protein
MKVYRSAWNRTSLLAIICAVMLISPDSRAQEEGDDAEAAGLLEEVIVTAQRRETNLQTTALAATVLSGEQLLAKGVDNLTRVQYVAPSVNISDFGSANVFNIRGIGRSKVDIEIPSGVVIYQDGVPTLAGYFQNEPYYDINSVEVLRGPQGTFVGKSASGGAIFVRTNSPVMNEISGNIEGGVGNNSLFETRGYFNASSNDTFAFRAAYNYQNRDHYYDSIYGPYTGDPGSRDLQSLRLGFLWNAGEHLSINLKVNYADLDFGGNVTSSFGDPIFVVPQDAPFEYTDESTRVVLDIDYVFDSGITFSSLTGFQTLETINNLDVNGSIVEPRYWFESAGDIDLWSQEFNLISDTDQRLRWVLGLFLQNQKSELLPVSEKG